MILMYTSFGCTSAIKAKAWLKENHLDYVEKNIQSTLLNKELTIRKSSNIDQL
ncbi:arsenate reductase-like glutaredoxin family protein [Breznakia sp. PF5-3]|nr:arsenate reductase-like glutaredoxin family protein [Breznakia sp. PF5-3]MDF9838039.1 arsenate reductase-like glutaredoxin family protein [Breznakia sp. PFB2-8]